MESFGFLFYIWFGSIVATGVIDRGKERNVALWLVVGLLLGPVGFLLALANPRGGKECPECAKMVRKGAIACKNCGVDFDQPRA